MLSDWSELQERIPKAGSAAPKNNKADPLAEFYDQAREEIDIEVSTIPFSALNTVQLWLSAPAPPYQSLHSTCTVEEDRNRGMNLLLTKKQKTLLASLVFPVRPS